MSRWAYLLAPIGVAIVVGSWWAADQLLTAPAPRLGPVIVVTEVPRPGTPAPVPPSPDLGDATTVPLPEPPRAGDDEPDEPDEPDDDDDLGETPDDD